MYMECGILPLGAQSAHIPFALENPPLFLCPEAFPWFVCAQKKLQLRKRERGHASETGPCHCNYHAY